MVLSNPDESPPPSPTPESIAPSSPFENVTLPSEKEIYQHFFDTLVIVMMSPSRYEATDHVKRHYEKFFAQIIFVGPLLDDLNKKNTSAGAAPTVVYTSREGIDVKGYDIVYGKEQYRAVRDVIREHILERKMKYDGFLYVSDDLMLNPWTLMSKKQTIPWIPQMGIANVKSVKAVEMVPGMSEMAQMRGKWIHWKQNRGLLTQVLTEGGPELNDALFQAANNTRNAVFKWSKYPSALRNNKETLRWSVFYTVPETYYIPFEMALKYAELCDLMAKHGVFGEGAIPTAVAALCPVHEELEILYYWMTKLPSDCWRLKWTPQINGFHRCRHDHPFTDLIYDAGDETRLKLLRNKKYLEWSKRLVQNNAKNKAWRP